MTNQSVSLSYCQPPVRLYLDTFGEEPATTRFVRLFTTNPQSREGLGLTIASGPPSLFRRTSPYRGLDQRASGLARVTSRPFRRRPLLLSQVWACCFRYGFLVMPVNLATRTNSLPRFSKRIARPCNLPFLLAPHDAFIQDRIFRAVPDYHQLGFRFFSPRFRDAFQLSLTILVSYRSLDVFRVTS